jgi:hypothetical protein
METYRHTQWGTVAIVSVSAAVVVCAVLAVMIPQGRVIAILAGAVLALTLPLFGSLTVVVDSRELKFWFGVGIIHKSYPLPKIRTCEVVRNSGMYGWGIHLTPHGWLYNVSGMVAIQVDLSGGKRFRLGSDEHEALCRAVKQAARL